MTERSSTELEVAHATLEAAYLTVLSLRGQLEHASTDTIFAIGEAAGLIAKAKALLGRDIDQLNWSKPQ